MSILPTTTNANSTRIRAGLASRSAGERRLTMVRNGLNGLPTTTWTSTTEWSPTCAASTSWLSFATIRRMLLRTATNGTKNVQTNMDSLLLALCGTRKWSTAKASALSGSNTTMRPLSAASMCSRILNASRGLATSVTMKIKAKSPTSLNQIFGRDTFGTTRPMRSKCLTGMQLKFFATMVSPAHLRLLLVSPLLMTPGSRYAKPSA